MRKRGDMAIQKNINKKKQREYNSPAKKFKKHRRNRIKKESNNYGRG